MTDPVEHMRAVEAAFRMGGVSACEALMEPLETTRRITEAVAAVLEERWWPVDIRVIDRTESPMEDFDTNDGKAYTRAKRRNSERFGVGVLLVQGCRSETDQELRARIKSRGGVIKAGVVLDPLSRSTVPIWGRMEWTWSYPDPFPIDFHKALTSLRRHVFQDTTELEARRTFAQVHGGDGG